MTIIIGTDRHYTTTVISCYSDTFVPGPYFQINEFSGFTESPISRDVEISSHTFCPTS